MEPTATENKPRVAVVGSGISGLVTASKLQEAGYSVDIYEKSDREGGKIKSTTVAGLAVDTGAEFVDTNHAGVIDLCNKFGIKLKKATDQDTEDYTLPSGKRVSGDMFSKAAWPLQKLVIEDKAALAKDTQGQLAAKLDGMSLAQYLQEKKVETESRDSQSLTSRISGLWNKALGAVMPDRQNIPNADVVATMAGIYVAESGRDARNISALQYVNEMSNIPGQFLASDCAFRVEGGTAQVTNALRKDLEAKGVKFHMNAEALGVSKQDNKFQVDFKDGSKQQADKVVFALPTVALAQVNGLESVGLSQEAIETLKTAQSAHSTKFSVATKGEGKDACTYSNEGVQVWRSGPGVMTFLVGGETLGQMKGKELVQHCLDSYAKAQGSTAEKLFDIDLKNPDNSKIIYSGANPGSPCYLSPAPGQVTKVTALSKELDTLAENGVGVVGTFIPQRTAGEASIGFMECGVQSAERVAGILSGKENEVPMDTKVWRNRVAANEDNYQKTVNAR